VPGGADRSYGIQVARLAGIPPGVIDRARKILYSIESGEHAFAGPAPASPGTRPAPRQLDLFRSVESQILERLRGVDITQLTPLDAMNLLSLLQEMAQMRETLENLHY
jgi:DNA mismatch repair protein MutS